MTFKSTALYRWIMPTVNMALYMAGCAIAGYVLATLDAGARPFSTILLMLILLALATGVRQIGHWLGARLAGMTVLQVQLLCVHIQPLRRGVQLRRARGLSGLPFVGYVLAAHNPDKQRRRSQLLFIAMGPLTNLLVGSLCLAIAFVLSAEPQASLLLAFAAMNLTLGLTSLIPTCGQVQSAGFSLLTWWRRPDETSPEFAYMRALALYVAGVAPEHMPVADLEQLSQQPMPMPLVALSFRLSALQAAGDWEGALQLDQVLTDLLDAHPKALKPCAASIAILHREMDFCRAIYHADAELLNTAPLNRDIDWYSPTLTPRCHALQAALQGDQARAEHYLNAAQTLAMNSQVRAFAPFEVAMAKHIRALYKEDRRDAAPL